MAMAAAVLVAASIWDLPAEAMAVWVVDFKKPSKKYDHYMSELGINAIANSHKFIYNRTKQALRMNRKERGFSHERKNC